MLAKRGEKDFGNCSDYGTVNGSYPTGIPKQMQFGSVVYIKGRICLTDKKKAGLFRPAFFNNCKS